MEAHVFIMADKFIVRRLMEILFKMLVQNVPLIDNHDDDGDVNEDSNTSTDSFSHNDDGHRKHQTAVDDMQLIHL
ncbi:hypothetical protein BLA29_014269 [Euroglyphus maynei]|uniref:Uncharacterized protein n=1 Tax=Euroglyphus maynei TaxID=6958 RepID=A0A1Y3BCV8_EURMA|nr:hypothetical protein BLA29_014269 [Euroglyphus maynei]